MGQRKTVVIGAVLMAIGQFFLAAESMFLVGLFFLIVGNGCFKPNLATQVGGLYPPGDPRMDRAYSIYYMGVNLGAFLRAASVRNAGTKIWLGLRIRVGGRRHGLRAHLLSVGPEVSRRRQSDARQERRTRKKFR